MCISKCVGVRVCLGTRAYVLLSLWELIAEPQGLPGAKETRDQDSGAGGEHRGAESILLAASPWSRAPGQQVSEPGCRVASGMTHLTCRPSCCTPRAGSSSSLSTPAWWAPRRRTPPGPRWGTCGQERGDQALTAGRCHPLLGSPRGPVTHPSLWSCPALGQSTPQTSLAWLPLSPNSVPQLQSPW